ncbi:hypothetical protein HHK36_026960 [Tetracentron sinense]|uniref:EF-hand domain-containing protein n=1 Tax=Tetracentron sinense TaxID=13715 RepID=A0A835D5Z2_TETSI|nr:hypothetical protein HHK36_026960 [Tetracentron sinense]
MLIMSKKRSSSAPASSYTPNTSLLMYQQPETSGNDYAVTKPTTKKEAREGEMDEMCEAALAYYEAGSEELKQLAREFFCSMDIDGDGRISYWEFMEFLRQRGHEVNKYHSFMALDTDRNDYLDFNEVLVYYYVVKAGRRTCTECKALMKGLYFTCVTCFDSCHESYDLCSSCYRHARHVHHHTYFLDNYAMLLSKKDSFWASTSTNTV